MATANASEISLRLEPGAYKRLAMALGISGGIHLVVLLFWFLLSSGKLDWLTQIVPAWLKPESILAEIIKKQAEQKVTPEELPTVFVDVSPQQATPEPPKKTEYYSDKNSRAANPEPTIDTETPRIDGKRTDMVKTEDIRKNKTFPLAPSVPQKNKEEQTELNAKPRYTPGDLVMAKPQPTPKKAPGEDQQDRPRTLK